MKFFWPRRSKAKGFLTQNLECKNIEKISSLSSSKTSDQLLADKNLKSIIKNRNEIVTSHFSIKRGHWANRDFSEYREAA